MATYFLERLATISSRGWPLLPEGAGKYYLEGLDTIQDGRDSVLGIDGTGTARNLEVPPQLLRPGQVCLAAEAAHRRLCGEGIRHC